MKYKKGEVWFAKVKFEDSDEIKKRPVLIIGEGYGFTISLKMITHEPRSNSDYMLRDWTKAGLDKKTIVRTSKACYLRDDDLVWKMGRLSEYDMLQIQILIAEQ